MMILSTLKVPLIYILECNQCVKFCKFIFKALPLKATLWITIVSRLWFWDFVFDDKKWLDFFSCSHNTIYQKNNVKRNNIDEIIDVHNRGNSQGQLSIQKKHHKRGKKARNLCQCVVGILIERKMQTLRCFLCSLRDKLSLNDDFDPHTITLWNDFFFVVGWNHAISFIKLLFSQDLRF